MKTSTILHQIGATLIVGAAFLAPWLHLQVWNLPLAATSPHAFAFFVVMLPLPLAALLSVVALQFAESKIVRHGFIAFLWGCLVYSPFWFLFTWAATSVAGHNRL